MSDVMRSDLFPRVAEPLPTFHPEFGRFMLEATPGAPFSLAWKDLLSVEPNMKLRYRLRHCCCVIIQLIIMLGEQLPKSI
jgi:hypothetical protein